MSSTSNQKKRRKFSVMLVGDGDGDGGSNPHLEQLTTDLCAFSTALKENDYMQQPIDIFQEKFGEEVEIKRIIHGKKLRLMSPDTEEWKNRERLSGTFAM